MKKILLMTLLLTNLSVTPSFADEEVPTTKQENHHRSKLSLNSSYFPFANSNRAMGDFMVEFSDAYGFIYENLEKTLGIENSLPYLLYDVLFGGVFNILLQLQTNITYHEFGHFSRVKSMGSKDAVFEGGYTNFFQYFGDRFTKIFSGSFVELSSKELNEYKSKFPDQIILFSAGGINNQTYLSELLSEKAYLHGIHPSTLGMYIYAKMAALAYISTAKGKDLDVYNPSNGGNDIMHMIEEYRTLGKNQIKTKDIGISSAISFFASGSVYAYYYSIWNLYTARNHTMRPFEFFGIRLPETYAYYMPQGISYKISSGYRYDNTLTFPFSVEFIQNGDKNYEFTLGVYKEFPEFKNASVRADLIISDQGEMGGKIYAEYSPVSNFYVGAGIENYNTKTLHGLRNIPSQENKETRSTEIWIQGGIKY